MSLHILSVYHRVEILEPSDEVLIAAAEAAYRSLVVACAEILDRPDADILVRVETGSLRTKAKVVAPLAVLYLAIANYDGFWNGIDRLERQARAAGGYVKRALDHQTAPLHVRHTSRISTGDLDRIRAALRAVERGALTADEAFRRIRRILLRAGDELPEAVEDEVVQRLRSAQSRAESRTATRRQVQQISLAQPMTVPADNERQAPREPEPPHPQPRVILEIARTAAGERRRRILEW
jgi:hypothetical protein